MDTRLLCHTDPDLGPEARWLLLQWSRVTGLDQALTCPLQDLYCLLGITTRQAKPALEWLKRHGYVIYDPVRRGRGRPVSRHRVSAGFRRLIEQEKVPCTPHLSELDELCTHSMASRKSAKQEPGNLIAGEMRARRLTPVTYWLLAVLLAHAETPGIVRGLSYGHLQAVTGMTRERLKSQLSKLKKLGVIARHQPGMLLSKEGVRMRSVYFIDLTHSLLLGDASLGLTVTYLPARRLGGANFISGIYEAAIVASYLAENVDTIRANIQKACEPTDGEKDPEKITKKLSLGRHYSDAYQKLRMNAISLLPSEKAVLPAKADLLRADKLGMGPILKAHIYSYAMMLLSHHWESVEYKRGGVSDPIEELMKVIKVDCAYLIGVDDSDGGSRLNGPLIECIYALAHHLAVSLKHTLKFVEDRDGLDYRLADAVFSIGLLKNEGGECWKIMSHFRSSDGVFRSCNIFYYSQSVSLSFSGDLNLLIKEGRCNVK